MDVPIKLYVAYIGITIPKRKEIKAKRYIQDKDIENAKLRILEHFEKYNLQGYSIRIDNVEEYNPKERNE